MDEGDQLADCGAGYTVTRTDLGDGSDLRVDLGSTLAHREVAPDARVALRVGAVERHHRRDAGACGILGRARRERRRLETIEATRLDALGPRHLKRFAAERAPYRQQLRTRKAIGDGGLAERLREQERAVGELAPQERPDVVGHDRVRRERAHDLVQRPQPRRDGAIELADDEGTCVAVEDPTGLEPVRAVIDEGADRSAAPNLLLDSQLAQAVLQRQHVAVERQMRLEHVRGIGRVLGLDGKKHAPPAAHDLSRYERWRLDGERLPGAVDLQALVANGGYMLRQHIDEGHIVTGTREIGPQRAAYGARTPNQDPVVHSFRPKREVSCTAAAMSSISVNSRMKAMAAPNGQFSRAIPC